MAILQKSRLGLASWPQDSLLSQEYVLDQLMILADYEGDADVQVAVLACAPSFRTLARHVCLIWLLLDVNSSGTLPFQKRLPYFSRQAAALRLQLTSSFPVQSNLQLDFRSLTSCHSPPDISRKYYLASSRTWYRMHRWRPPWSRSLLSLPE